MKTVKTLVVASVLALFAFAFGSCSKSEDGQGPMERAGKSMDQAVDKAKEQVGQAVEKAGEAVKEAGEQIRKGVTKDQKQQ